MLNDNKITKEMGITWLFLLLYLNLDLNLNMKICNKYIYYLGKNKDKLFPILPLKDWI